MVGMATQIDRTAASLSEIPYFLSILADDCMAPLTFSPCTLLWQLN